MDLTELPSSPIPGLNVVELTHVHVGALQRFFENNSEYSMAMNGEPPGPNEAREAIFGELPAGWSFTKKWVIGYRDANGVVVAMANVVSDLLAPSVWHIGLFMVATERHGDGSSQKICRGLEAWAHANGASWLRLGVVQGNVKAERFWQKLGFIEVRIRRDVAMGRLTNTIRAMFKPLRGGTLEQYLDLVERDRPDAESAPPPPSPG
ncbi:MAG: GNAT family N-acetyltransferase [Casimicrobium sp.]|jgi:GNAT superfamily N-acetyltransferase